MLEGSVRKAGNKVRVPAQLINVADGYHLWSQRFDRDLEDVFAIQDEISLAIVDKLKIACIGAGISGTAQMLNFERFEPGCCVAFSDLTRENFDRRMDSLFGQQEKEAVHFKADGTSIRPGFRDLPYYEDPDEMAVAYGCSLGGGFTDQRPGQSAVRRIDPVLLAAGRGIRVGGSDVPVRTAPERP